MRLAAPLLVAACAGLALGACHRSPRLDVNAADAGAVALSQSYPAPNNLLTARYPADFAAKISGKSAVVLARNLGGGEDEAITLVSVATPISNDANEYDRVVLLAEESKFEAYAQTARRTTTCFGSPCVETEGDWKTASGRPYRVQFRSFIHRGHGYTFTALAPIHLAGSEVPFLDRIMDATELAD